MTNWDFRSSELELLGRYTYLIPEQQDRPPLKLICADGPRALQAEERNKRSNMLRTAIQDNAMLKNLFPSVRYIGDCTIDGRNIPGLITEFADGYDLFQILKDSEDLGAALAELHIINPYELEFANVKTEGPFQKNWLNHMLFWVQRLTKELSEVEPTVLMGQCSIGEVQKLIGKLEDVVNKCSSYFEFLTTPSVIHNDAHGGNFVAINQNGVWRLNGIIDERLRGGDRLFDVASLFDWSFEVFDDESHRKFSETFSLAYSNKSISTEEIYRLMLYIIERSVGRLDFYLTMPAQDREKVDSKSVSRLHRHIELLDLVVSAVLNKNIAPIRLLFGLPG
jgi:hypothetical protein